MHLMLIFCSACRRSHIEEVQSDINMFGLHHSYSESVCNAHLAIDWLEATYPELRGHLFEGDSASVLVAYPYAPIDASLSLQARSENLFEITALQCYILFSEIDKLAWFWNIWGAHIVISSVI